MLGKDMPGFRGWKERSSFVFLEKVACSAGSCPVTRASGALQSWPPPAVMVKHTAVVPLVRADLSRVSFLSLHFTHCTWFLLPPVHTPLLLGAHSLCLFKKWLKVCAGLRPPWPPLAVAHCRALSISLAPCSPPVSSAPVLPAPQQYTCLALTLHLVSHALGSSLQLLCRLYPELPCCVIHSVGSIARLLSKYLTD